MAAAADELTALDATWTLLGNGESRYEELLTWLAPATRTASRRRLDSTSGSRTSSKRAQTLFLMPSRFEPCGLNQMYSLRYGTVPIVRATGGLEDTVEDYDPATGRGTGFKFRDYTPAALVRRRQPGRRALPEPPAWAKVQQAGMRQDLSWDVSAREYVKVYEGAMGLTAAR